MIDMKRPDTGSAYSAHGTPPVTATTKQSRMLPLHSASTACQRNVFKSHAPRNRPAARSKKKTETAYAASVTALPEYPASNVGIQTYTAASTPTYRNAAVENART